MINGILDDLPEYIKMTMDDVMFAKLYNAALGANVTHREVAGWGMNEREAIRSVIDLI